MFLPLPVSAVPALVAPTVGRRMRPMRGHGRWCADGGPAGTGLPPSRRPRCGARWGRRGPTAPGGHRPGRRGASDAVPAWSGCPAATATSARSSRPAAGPDAFAVRRGTAGAGNSADRRDLRERRRRTRRGCRRAHRPPDRVGFLVDRYDSPAPGAPPCAHCPASSTRARLAAGRSAPFMSTEFPGRAVSAYEGLSGHAPKPMAYGSCTAVPIATPRGGGRLPHDRARSVTNVAVLVRREPFERGADRRARSA